VKQIRKRLTYANVTSSIALFLVLGGATAVAAQKIGANELKANAVKTGKIVKEAVTTSKLKKSAVTTDKIADLAVTTGKIADLAVTTGKIANDAVTGDKVKESTLGQVPSAANAQQLGGIAASGYAPRLFARVSYENATPTIIASSPGVTTDGEGALGFPRVVFPRAVDNCSVIGSASTGSGNQIVRRSTSLFGDLGEVQMAIHDDAGTSIRSDFDLIAIC